MTSPSKASAQLSWDDVRLFLALSRARTVGEAAKSLGVDASTASRRLAELESVLAVTLFARSRDGIAATKAAEDLLLAAEEVEQGVAHFTNTVDGLEREIAGLVRLTCPRDAAEIVVAPMLGRLLAEHPRLRVELNPGESVLDLTRGEADLALRVVRPTRGDLVMTKVTSASWVVAATPRLASELGVLRAWRDARWVGWSERYAGVPAARWLAKHLGAVEPVVRSDNLTTQIALVRAGCGLALVPRPSVEHYGLVPVKLAKGLRAAAAELPCDDLYLVTHRALRDVPRVRIVWEALSEQFRLMGMASV